MDLNKFYQDLNEIFRTKNVLDAETFMKQALDTAQETGDLAGQLVVHNELGSVYRVTNRYPEAKAEYIQAAALIEKLGLAASEQHGTIMLNLASVYSEAGELEEALKLYLEVEFFYQRLGLQRDYRVAALYNNLSHVYDRLHRLDEAVAASQKALDLIQILSNDEIKVEVATSHTNLAIRLMKQRRYSKAASHLAAADQIFQSLHGRPDPHYPATLNAMGMILYLKGEYQEAAAHYERALEVIHSYYGENSYYAEVSRNLAAAREAAGKRIPGLALSEAWFVAYGEPMIEELFPAHRKEMAIGMVGEGSDCYGFDDAYSESHDFGPGFCIWLPEKLFQEIGADLQAAYDRLPKEYLGKRRVESPEGGGRTGIFSIGEFYRKYLGCPGVPATPVEWLAAPENGFAVATGGRVFEDGLGEFTAIRNGLLEFYPQDVFLKKLAARIALAAQAGQYNYPRCLDHGDPAAAYLACAEFVKQAASIVYLLSRKYSPFYKWIFRGMDGLDRLREVKPLLQKLISRPDDPESRKEKVEIIEEICILIRDEMRSMGLTKGTDAFLNSHASGIMNQIEDPQIRKLPVMYYGR